MDGLHKWTNGGDKVLALRVINADCTSGPNNDFVNATDPGSIIECQDWSDEARCGNGLHAWPWGHGRDGKKHSGNVLWQVVACEPELGVSLDGKAKWPRFEVVKTTPILAECVVLLIDGLVAYLRQSSVSATGDSSSVSATGYGSSVSATGDSSSVSATGERSVAVSLGFCGRVAAGESGVIVCLHQDRDGTICLKVGEIGKNGLKPGVFYMVENGEFVEDAAS